MFDEQILKKENSFTVVQIYVSALYPDVRSFSPIRPGPGTGSESEREALMSHVFNHSLIRNEAVCRHGDSILSIDWLLWTWDTESDNDFYLWSLRKHHRGWSTEWNSNQLFTVNECNTVERWRPNKVFHVWCSCGGRFLMITSGLFFIIIMFLGCPSIHGSHFVNTISPLSSMTGGWTDETPEVRGHCDLTLHIFNLRICRRVQMWRLSSCLSSGTSSKKKF